VQVKESVVDETTEKWERKNGISVMDLHSRINTFHDIC